MLRPNQRRAHIDAEVQERNFPPLASEAITHLVLQNELMNIHEAVRKQSTNESTPTPTTEERQSRSLRHRRQCRPRRHCEPYPRSIYRDIYPIMNYDQAMPRLHIHQRSLR